MLSKVERIKAAEDDQPILDPLPSRSSHVLLSMLSQERARRSRPLNNSISSSSQVSPHPQEVAHVFNTITEISAASAEIIRRPAEEVYPICPIGHCTYQFVTNCHSNSREETHVTVYLPPRWTEYLPSQNLYGKKLCYSPYPSSHHFTSL